MCARDRWRRLHRRQLRALVLECDPHVNVVNLDLLTYAGNLESLADVFRRHGPDGDGRTSLSRQTSATSRHCAGCSRGGVRDSQAGAAARRIPAPTPGSYGRRVARGPLDHGAGGVCGHERTGTLTVLEACRRSSSGPGGRSVAAREHRRGVRQPGRARPGVTEATPWRPQPIPPARPLPTCSSDRM